MAAASLWVGLVSSVLLAANLEAPVLWSPDGRWVAYTTTAPQVMDVLPPWWLFETGTDKPPRTKPEAAKPLAESFQLWVTSVDNNESFLLAESPGSLSSPSWNPDGTALTFARLIPLDAQSARYEIVIHDAKGPRVLLSQTLSGIANDAGERVAGASIAWSPDGRHIAAPRVQPSGLIFVRTDNGHALKSIEGAFLPTWSFDGTKVAFYRSGAPESLCWMDSNFGEPRRLADAPQATLLPAPAWSRDARTVLFVRRGTGAAGWGGSKIQSAELVRVRVENNTVETIRTILHEPMTSADMFRAASYSFDSEGEGFFYTTSTRGQKSQITLAQPNGIIRKRFNPFDELVPLGSLAFSPTIRRLALRVGAAGALGGPALCDPETEKLIPLAPDAAARAHWLTAIVGTARQIMAEIPAQAEPNGPKIERPTLLPSAAELAENAPAASRLRRLGRIGRGLCDPAAGLPAPAEPYASVLDEGRLFCSYLSGDYAAALTALDTLESKSASPDVKRRLLGLRAQIGLALGERDEARAMLDYLKAGRRGPTHRFEETAGKPVLSAIADPMEGWLALLSRQVEKRGVGNPDEAPVPPMGPNDPDTFEQLNVTEPPMPVQRPAGAAPIPPAQRLVQPRTSRPGPVPPPPMPPGGLAPAPPRT